MLCSYVLQKWASRRFKGGGGQNALIDITSIRLSARKKSPSPVSTSQGHQSSQSVGQPLTTEAVTRPALKAVRTERRSLCAGGTEIRPEAVITTIAMLLPKASYHAQEREGAACIGREKTLFLQATPSLPPKGALTRANPLQQMR